MIGLIILLCLVGFILWLVPMDSRIKTVIVILVAIVVAVMLYNTYGGGSIKLPSFK